MLEHNREELIAAMKALLKLGTDVRQLVMGHKHHTSSIIFWLHLPKEHTLSGFMAAGPILLVSAFLWR